jgi:tight adherence protein B
MILKGRSLKYLSPGVFVLLLFISNLLLAIIGFVLAFGLPKFMEYRNKKIINDKFKSQLLDGVELIAGSLRSGMTFQQSIAFIIRELPQPLAGDFKEVQDKILLGVNIEKALLELNKKHQDDNLELFVTSVIISRETGGNLAEVLSKVSENMRENSRLEGQINILTSQGKLSGLIIGLLPFILLLFFSFIDRDLISPMFNTSLGIVLSVSALIMELIGALFIRRITRIEF